MKPLKRVLLLPALALLSACGGPPVPTATVKPLCPAVKHICIKNADVLTEDTASSIEGNNLGRARLCGAPPRCKKA